MSKLVKINTATVLATKIVSIQIDPFNSRRILVRLMQDKQPLSINHADENTAIAQLSIATTAWEESLRV